MDQTQIMLIQDSDNDVCKNPFMETSIRPQTYVFLTCLLLIFFFGNTLFGWERPPEESKQILVLNSYHRGFLWTDEIIRGIEETLAGANVDLNIEYLDTKRQFDDAYENILNKLEKELLRLKHNKHRYDMVITSDNNAFSFFQEWGHQIFGTTPHVFCGVNYLSKQDMERLNHSTGVNEQINIAGNLSLIRRLHPDCREIIVITDNTTTGKRIQKEVERIRRLRSPPDPELNLLFDVSAAKLVDTVRHLPPHTIILFTLFFRDNTETFFEYDQGVKMVCDNAKVPVYGSWDFQLNHGITGGYLVLGFDQGTATAKKALTILAGQAPGNIPVNYETPTRLRFDYRQLRRHNIPINLLPPESEILHQPVSLYERHKKIIWSTISVFCLLLLSLLGLAFGLLRSRQAAGRIRESEEKYRRLVESLGREYFLYTHDTDHVFSYLSPSITEMLGYGQEEFKTHCTAYLTDNQLNKDAVKRSEASLRGVKQSPYPLEILHKSGTFRLLEITEVPIFDTDGKVVAVDGIAHDITELKQAEKDIKINEMRLEALLALSQMTDASKKQISDFALEEAVRLTGSKVGYLHFFNETQETIDLYSWSKETLKICTAEKESHYPLEQAGVWADSVRKRQPVIHNDYPGLTQKKGFPEGHFPISRHLSVPIFDNDRIVAVAGVGNKTAPYGDTDVKQLSLFMNSMWQIFKKRQAEKELREREQFLSTILENIPDMIFAKDVKTLKFISINRAGESILGYPKDEVIGKTNHELYRKEDADVVSAIDRQVLETNRRVEIADHQLHRKDGKKLFLHTKKIPVKDETGTPRYLVGISENITDRKADKRLRKLLQAAMENAGESIMITDAGTHIQYVNPTFEKITGYYRKELIGKKTNILKSGRHDDAFYRDMWQTLASGKTWTGILKNKKKDGSLFTEEATISPMADNKGDIVNYVAVKRDVTEKIKLEKQIQQAQKLESIGTLAGGIAHDFNNILTAIIGFTQLAISDAPKESGLADDLAEVYKASMRARDLVQQILSFSRQNETQFAPVAIRPVLKEAFKLLRASLPTSIDMRMDIQSGAKVYCDATQIHQVIMNLCTNAYHAMETNGGVLEVKLTEEILDPLFLEDAQGIENGRFLMMSISDTGTGMSSEVQEKIFDPFFTTKELGKGTGIGLSVVHGIVKSHQGLIRVYSEPGIGTTFKLFFPIFSGTASSKNEEIVKSPVKSARILFVDDEESLTKLGKRLLSSMGHEVITHTSSIEALSQFKKNPALFDLVITDLTMPEMTGDVLAEKIKQIRSDIPVLLCSGYATPEMTNRREFSAISAIIHKPILVHDIVEKINRVMGSS